jgi:cytochrome c oxidase cbb3-type subunit 4
MNPIWGHIVGIATVIVMLAFIGIWVWAWHPQHKPDFDALAKLPLEDEEDDKAMEDER